MSSWIDRNATVFKVLLCGFLLLLMMIPTSMIKGLVDERQNRASGASREIMSKWGDRQVLTGPIISVPFEFDKQTRYYHILPNTLNNITTLKPEIRSRGIYDAIVYTAESSIEAQFGKLIDMVPESFSQKKNLAWDQSIISMGIQDVRGIQKNIDVVIGSEKFPMNPGLITSDVIASGVSREISLDPASTPKIGLAISLKGGEQIQFVPLGETTTVTVSGPWTSPSFNGAKLPDERTVTETDFTALWKSNKYSRNFPQSWEGSSYQLNSLPETTEYQYSDPYFDKNMVQTSTAGEGTRGNIGESAYGVRLIETVDNYDKSRRTINYAFLIIGLSFLVFFLMEVIRKRPVHILQYLLIGFALVVFYTLQISLSEHIGFDPAYVLSALATITLIGLYTRSIWDDSRSALMTSGVLAILYTLVFIILQSEDYALLIGSIAVFLILAFLMYVTRHIDWYGGRK